MFQLQFAYLPLLYIECFVTLGLAGLFYSFSIVKDVTYSLRLFNKMARTKRTRSKLMESIVEIIRFMNLRELSSTNSNQIKWENIKLFPIFSRLAGYIVDVYSITLMALFMGCTGAICLTLLMIQVDLVQVLLRSIWYNFFFDSLRFVSRTVIWWCYWSRCFWVV